MVLCVAGRLRRGQLREPRVAAAVDAVAVVAAGAAVRNGHDVAAVDFVMRPETIG